jgi:primosomal protein N' (replication factor Y) (superfamily II helicase)
MKIVADVIIPPLGQAYSYEVPIELRDSILCGTQVTVSLGRRQATGFVTAIREVNPQDLSPDFSLKRIQAHTSSPQQFFTENELLFYRWASEYYCEPLGVILEAAIPRYVAPKTEAKLYHNDLNLAQTVKGKVQLRVLEEVYKHPGISLKELTKLIPTAANSVRRLLDQQILRVETTEATPKQSNSTEQANWAKKEIELNIDQQNAVTKICEDLRNKRFSASLLFGVTGSGKTEVYIEAVKEALRLGYGALIIVPEIALTPQLIDRFIARLHVDVAILHSGLNQSMRWNSWRALLEKKAFVAIGARSAIFAPVNNLGLIIADEEHDSSFKQAEGLRYNARDLAIARANLLSTPVVLGSATPSLETYANARRGKYDLLRLPNRPIGTPELSIEIVDLNKIKFKDRPSSLLSPELYRALDQTIKSGSQAFVMYNKRGFASFLQCEGCGHVPKCPRCNLTLTYHQTNSRLCCHYCGYQARSSGSCSECSAADSPNNKSSLTIEVDQRGVITNRSQGSCQYQLRGAGTEKVVDELKELFPAIQIDRLDRDSIANFSEYRKILNRLRSGEIQILVGTQMIAKGHDLPGVTLVGVIDCDVGLHFPDLRASERVFQLITQVAGRAGRANLPGKVILQTRAPNNLCLRHAVRQDYENFALEELSERRQLGFPPYSRLLRVICAAYNKSKAEDFAKMVTYEIGKLAQEHKLEINILGPAEAPLSKLRLYWRQHIIIKSAKHSQLQVLVQNLKKIKPKEKSLRLLFDLDPLDLL